MSSKGELIRRLASDCGWRHFERGLFRPYVKEVAPVNKRNNVTVCTNASVGKSAGVEGSRRGWSAPDDAGTCGCGVEISLRREHRIITTPLNGEVELSLGQ